MNFHVIELSINEETEAEAEENECEETEETWAEAEETEAKETYFAL